MMTLIPLIVTLVLLAVVIIYVTRPLFTSGAETENNPLLLSAELKESAYQAVLERIRELDFEFKLGNMNRQEHEALRAALVQEAAEALRELRTSDPRPASCLDKPSDD